MSLFFYSDSQRFENELVEANHVYANISGPALFKWRYTPKNNDIPPSNIMCYFEQNGDQVQVITRSGTNNPVVQTNDVRNTPLNGKVQGYVDSTDPTVFGFIITGITKSDPKEYRCIAAVNTQSRVTVEVSPKLSLQVLGNKGSLLFVSDL